MPLPRAPTALAAQQQWRAQDRTRGLLGCGWKGNTGVLGVCVPTDEPECVRMYKWTCKHGGACVCVWAHMTAPV